MATFHSDEEDSRILSDVQDSKTKIENFISQLNKDEEETRMVIILECQLMRQKLEELETKALENLKSVYDFYTQKSKNSLERCDSVIKNLQNRCSPESIKTDIGIIKELFNNELCLNSFKEDTLLSFHVDQSFKDCINNAAYLGEIKLNMAAKEIDCVSAVTVRENKSIDAVKKIYNVTETKSEQEIEPKQFSCRVESPHGTHYAEINTNQSQSKTACHLESGLSPSSTVSTTSATSQIETVLPSGPPKRAVYEITFVAKSVTDKLDCHLNGACFLTDRRLVLADQRNKKIKLFAVSLQLQAEIDLGSKPFDVTETKNTEIAVTVPDKHLIQFYDSSLKFVDSIETQQPCLGITVAKENIYVLCESIDSKPCCINVYNNSKQLVSKMTKGSLGKPLLKGSEYVTVCQSTETIYFARRTFEECKIFSIGVTGNVNWKSDVSSADISEASFSLAAVEGGVVVAADCVRCISNKGKTKKKLMSSREKGLPYAIAVNPERTMLLVTYFAPEFGDSKTNNFVNLYRLFY